MAMTPFWRAHGWGDSARTGRATNCDRRRGRSGRNPRERNDNRLAAARDGAPPPARGRARRRLRRRPAPGPAAVAVRAARPHLPRRTRIDPSGGAHGAQGDRRRLPARRGARDAEGRRRRRRSGLAPRSLRSDLVEAHIGLAPREFKLHARNPARDLAIGGRHVAFGSVASAPNSFDRAGGRRPGNQARLSELHPPRAEFRFDSLLGRLSGRADRHSCLRPPSRRAVRHADAVRQADPRLQPRARAHSRRDRDGQDRAWARRRDAGARAVAVHGHQLVVAIEARHADAGGRHPDGAPQPGGGA